MKINKIKNIRNVLVQLELASIGSCPVARYPHETH
jgi:hypothetical protein